MTLSKKTKKTDGGVSVAVIDRLIFDGLASPKSAAALKAYENPSHAKAFRNGYLYAVIGHDKENPYRQTVAGSTFFHAFLSGRQAAIDDGKRMVFGKLMRPASPGSRQLVPVKRGRRPVKRSLGSVSKKA